MRKDHSEIWKLELRAEAVAVGVRYAAPLFNYIGNPEEPSRAVVFSQVSSSKRLETTRFLLKHTIQSSKALKNSSCYSPVV